MVWNPKWDDRSLRSFDNGLDCPKDTIIVIFGDLGTNWFDEGPIQETNKIYGSFSLSLTNLGNEDY